MAEPAEMDTLVLTIGLFRHGERAPIFIRPESPNLNHWTSIGKGNLTPDGRRQCYALGEFLRERYDGFLNRKYLEHEIYVYSTDLNRNLMSAQCCLAAMYKPIDDQRWHPEIDWQPIPVHTKPQDQDLQAPPSTSLLINYTKSNVTEELQKAAMKHREIFKKLADYGGFFIDNLFSILFLIDAIVVESESNLTPDCPADVSIEEIRYVQESLLQSITEIIPHYVKQGDELAEIVVEHFNDLITGNKTKMFLYMLHDCNVYNLSKKLGIKLNWACVSGGVMLELHKMVGQYYVKLVERSGRSCKVRNVPICDFEFCPLEKFKQIIESASSSTVEDVTDALSDTKIQ